MTDPAPPRRAYVETYGCQMNISDGELMEGVLASRGYRLVSSPEEADVILVNTCAIRDHAEQRVLGRVGQLSAVRRERPDVIIGVTGCMAQRMGASLLEEAPHVDLVMGPDGYRSLPDQLDRLRSRGGVELAPEVPADAAPDPALRRPAGSGTFARKAPARSARGGTSSGGGRGRIQLAVLDLDTGENYEGLEQRRTSRVAAWIPIQRGCDHRCTYCIVPYVRGPEKNRRPGEVLAEVRGLAERGITEVTLLGQTVNSYRHGEVTFPELLRDVARVDGIRRVRFTSPHPGDVTPELVEVMAVEGAVCEQLHLPAQSGSDRVLKRMVRRYTVESFLRKVEMVREAIPDIALSTDIIVAFPGETDDQFRETLELMRTVRFDDAFTYKYSLREGTPATRLPEGDFVDDRVAQARLEELIDVARGIQAEINRSEVGRTEEVLIEKEARDPGHLLGRTRRNKVVAFPGEDLGAAPGEDLGAAPGEDLEAAPGEGLAVGDYARVELTRTTGATFVGRAVGVTAGAASG